MPSLDVAIPHLVPFVLVAFRLGGMFLLAPMLTSAMIPPRFKVLMVVAMAGSLYPTLPTAPAPDVDLFSLLPLVVCELAIGFIMGLIAAAIRRKYAPLQPDLLRRDPELARWVRGASQTIGV